MCVTRIIGLVGLTCLLGCGPSQPDSGYTGVVPDIGRGVGFNNSLPELTVRPDLPASAPQTAARSASIRADQTQRLSSETVPPVRQSTPRGAASAGRSQQADDGFTDPELAQIARDADARAAARNSGQAVVNASPSNAPPRIVNNPGISSEQDFGSVSERRSIEGDAARIAQNRQQYRVIRPTDLPRRPGSNQPNIVAYALQTEHPPGTRIYRRSGLRNAQKFERNCAAYPSDDEAQIDFLSSGGPTRDRKGLDPDGDGYACGWDPRPFRRVRG